MLKLMIDKRHANKENELVQGKTPRTAENEFVFTGI